MSKFYNIDISTNLGGVDASDIKVSSQKSIKTYIDGGMQTVAYIGLDESISDIIDSATGKQVDISLYAEKLWVQDQGYLTLQTLPSDLGKQSDWTQTDDTQVDFIKHKPTIPSAPGTLNTNNTTAQTASSSESLSGTISLHKVSKTGSYNDLLNKPTIPSAPGTLNTNNTSGQSASSSESLSGTIKLHKVSKTGSYNDLLNKPTIPTLTSQLTNDSGFITSEDALPSVTAADNGKVLMVVNGSWAPTMIQTNVYFTGNTAPSSSLGNDGDLYLETM